MRIEHAALVLSNIRSGDLIDSQTQKTMCVTFDLVPIGGFQTHSILVPFHRGIWVAITTGCEFGLHAVIGFQIANAFQEGWGLSTLTLLTENK